jgi:polyisoprenoid-binding protein YceI
MRACALVIACLSLSAAAEASIAPGTYAVDASASTLKYTVVHKLHQVDATSKQVEGKAILRPDGAILTEVRAPVASFRSGDGNRDEHMDEVMEVAEHPLVVLKAVGKLADLRFTAQVDLHAVKKTYPVEVKLQPQDDGSVRATAAFDVDLDAHRIERPSLLFVKIENACRIDVDLLLRPEPK